jgi:oxygen-dependent protoporphyrinogen oxidase
MGGPRGTLHSFDRGLGVLIEALASKAEVRTSASVQRLERTPKGYRLSFASGEPLEADEVVLSVPTYEMARLLRPLAGDAAGALEGVAYPPVVVVVQAFDRADVPRTHDGFGFLAPNVEGRQVLGSIWASTVFEGHAPSGTVMLRTLLGGVRRAELALGDDETLLGRARAELEALVGIPRRAVPRAQKVIRWDRAIPQYDVGHLGRIRAADELEQRFPGLYLSGNGLRGVSMVQCVTAAGALSARILASSPHT